MEPYSNAGLEKDGIQMLVDAISAYSLSSLI
jgi:hypothetical protein